MATDFAEKDKTISAVSAHFLLAAATVTYTCSGDPSGEGLAFS
jgi:hypothetical protein